MLKYIAGGVVSVLLLSGCANQQPSNNKTTTNTNQSSEPKWMDDPYMDGDKVAATGCAKRHFKGSAAQKKLAISRAIDQIASQVETTVDNVMDTSRQVRNGSGVSSQMRTNSSQKVNNVNISTKVKATYKKPNGEICVWVVQR